MVIINTVKLVLIVFKACCRLVWDAVGDITGGSLPFKADDVAKPDTLARLINEGALQPHPAPIVIQLGSASGHTLCEQQLPQSCIDDRTGR